MDSPSSLIGHWQERGSGIRDVPVENSSASPLLPPDLQMCGEEIQRSLSTMSELTLSAAWPHITASWLRSGTSAASAPTDSEGTHEIWDAPWTLPSDLVAAPYLTTMPFGADSLASLYQEPLPAGALVVDLRPAQAASPSTVLMRDDGHACRRSPHQVSQAPRASPAPPPLPSSSSSSTPVSKHKSPTVSTGSALHQARLCKPCAWYWKSEGCWNGSQCKHCHMCPSGEIKNRSKMKKVKIASSDLDPVMLDGHSDLQ